MISSHRVDCAIVSSRNQSSRKQLRPVLLKRLCAFHKVQILIIRFGMGPGVLPFKKLPGRSIWLKRKCQVVGGEQTMRRKVAGDETGKVAQGQCMKDRYHNNDTALSGHTAVRVKPYLILIGFKVCLILRPEFLAAILCQVSLSRRLTLLPSSLSFIEQGEVYAHNHTSESRVSTSIHCICSRSLNQGRVL